MKDNPVLGKYLADAINPDATPLVDVGELNHLTAAVASTAVRSPNTEIASSPWRPIETAPKDGTKVFLASVDPRGTAAIIECSWWSAERCAQAEGGEPEDYEADWYQVYDSLLSFCRPTHWLPALMHPRDCAPQTQVGDNLTGEAADDTGNCPPFPSCAPGV